MAKNLIQRMQSGGRIQPSDVEQYQPIKMFEPAGKWQTALDIYNKQFDPELELARDSLEFKRKEARDAKELAQDTLALETRKLQESILSDKRKDARAKTKSDFDIYSSAVEGLDFGMAASVAQGMEMDTLATINTDLAGKVSEANQAFSEAVANNNYKQANKIFNDNSILFSRNDVNLKAKENELQGMYAKSILPSLLSIDGVKNSLGDELYNRWSDPNLSNAAALNAFNSFVPTLSIARGANEDNIKALKTFIELSPSLYEAAVDANSQTLINSLNEKVVPAINKLTESAFKTGRPSKEDKEKKTSGLFVTAGLDDPKTKKDERVKTPLEPLGKYNVQFKTIDGSTKKLKMTGEEISRREKREGIKVISADIIGERIVSKTGKPNIEVNQKIKDLKTGKVLTYEGLQEVVTNLPYAKTKYLQFRDSDGKRVRYTVAQAYNREFGPSTEVFQPMQQDKKQSEIKLPMNQVIAEPSSASDIGEVDAIFQKYSNITPD